MKRERIKTGRIKTAIFMLTMGILISARSTDSEAAEAESESAVEIVDVAGAEEAVGSVNVTESEGRDFGIRRGDGSGRNGGEDGGGN